MPKKPCAYPGCFRLVDLGAGYCRVHAAAEKRERDRPADARRADKPSRKWYKRKAWCGPGGRRAVQLAKEPLCRLCPPFSRQRATIADHIVPHREDHALFWFGELQSLCKSCHDIKKQRAERRTTGPKPDRP
ncbi:HNH endonuclease [Primorskyibacter sp. 2E107]|uniref:HNH endonuclease n=1 Tax=Primorskyibacter sp. 2E107 TaxID=3403458 RepID=UPI003AF62CFA